MHLIWKYELPARLSLLWIPEGAKLLYAGEQGGVAYVWAEVDPDAPRTKRRVRIFATGEGWDLGDVVHISTWQNEEGLVWHAYDCGVVNV